MELLRRAKIAGYTSKKTQFFEMVRRLRPKDRRPLVRFEGLTGEFIQHDIDETRYAQVKIVDHQHAAIRVCL